MHSQSFGDSVMPSSDGCRCWVPPDLGNFKLNVDAPWNVDSSGVEGLIRDHKG